MIWANLIHLSYNMWLDRGGPFTAGIPGGDDIVAQPFLRFDDALWRELRQQMVEAGINMVVLDLGDGVRYESHPEIAVENAWTPARLREELAELRGLGLEPIPKLNFATAHDVWLKEYAFCVSSPTYYRVCAELIQEVLELFGQPRFFHLGMDEEKVDFGYNRHARHVVVRQHDLWWHDLLYLVDQVEAGGSRAWVWADAAWNPAQHDTYLKQMPKSVLQSNWYYGVDFATDTKAVPLFADLAAAGFDQIPTGSNYGRRHDDNFEQLVDHIRANVSPDQVLGFLQTPWLPTLPKYRDAHLAAIAAVANARIQSDERWT